MSFSFALASDFQAIVDTSYARGTIPWSAFESAGTQEHSDDSRYRQSWWCGFEDEVKRKRDREKQSSGSREMIFSSWIPTAFRCVPAQRALWMSWYKLDGVVMLRRTMSLHTIPFSGDTDKVSHRGERMAGKNEKKISRAITNWYNSWERLWRKSFSAFLVQFHLRVAFIYFTLSYSSFFLVFFNFFNFFSFSVCQRVHRAHRQ